MSTPMRCWPNWGSWPRRSPGCGATALRAWVDHGTAGQTTDAMSVAPIPPILNRPVWSGAMFESLQRQISAHPAHLATILAIPMLAPLVAFTLSHVVFALDPFNLNAPQSFWEAWARVVEGRQDFDNILWTVRLVQSVGNLMAGALMLVWIRYAVELFR